MYDDDPDWRVYFGAYNFNHKHPVKIDIAETQ